MVSKGRRADGRLYNLWSPWSTQRRKEDMQPKAARNISIEALRLVAVAGIAVFHTFQ